jgi:predicted exporter
MTDAQREDMQYFENLLSSSSSPDMTKVYVLSAGKDYDEALMGNSSIVPVIDSLCAEGLVAGYRGVSRFLVSKQEQQNRLDMWADFVARHSEELPAAVRSNALKSGFSANAFDGFLNLFESSKDLHPEDIGYFSVLTKLILSQNVTTVETTDKAYIVNVLDVDKGDMDAVKSCFPHSFDVAGMNSALSKNLSDDFNYIGWACSLIVFFFLWFSFGHIELAMIAFLPMAVSWIWILGIMAIFGIKFNIVMSFLLRSSSDRVMTTQYS